ncbi:MAG: hypothetical protein BWY06_01154 [Candidatus Latescibacteria bacterium ADurb.Bin168]|nr:MAG: hypothetical protein BWY06_01154 [Candidatus Latescibacteria bacterium ADurb.Bin168]
MEEVEKVYLLLGVQSRCFVVEMLVRIEQGDCVDRGGDSLVKFGHWFLLLWADLESDRLRNGMYQTGRRVPKQCRMEAPLPQTPERAIFGWRGKSALT